MTVLDIVSAYLNFENMSSLFITEKKEVNMSCMQLKIAYFSMTLHEHGKCICADTETVISELEPTPLD